MRRDAAASRRNFLQSLTAGVLGGTAAAAMPIGAQPPAAELSVAAPAKAYQVFERDYDEYGEGLFPTGKEHAVSTIYRNEADAEAKRQEWLDGWKKGVDPRDFQFNTDNYDELEDFEYQARDGQVGSGLEFIEMAEAQPEDYPRLWELLWSHGVWEPYWIEEIEIV